MPPAHDPSAPAAVDGVPAAPAGGGPPATHVIAIGASAGGLEALQQMFDGIDPGLGVAFVVAQHLSPDFKSLMPELLARHTPMPVLSADHDQPLRRNTVYVLAAGFSVTIDGDMVRVLTRPPLGAVNLPINLLFQSIAGLGPRGVAVILSGTGQDGTTGARGVRAAGGLVIAQTPSSARFDSMPRAAIDSGCVDIVALPGEMGQALRQYIQDPEHGRHFASATQRADPILAGPYDPVLQQLRTAFDIDFSHYKPGTILRRIERRLGLLGPDVSPQDLASRLSTSRAELDAMFSDLLIGVTRFMRDPDAFESLAHRVIEPAVKALGPLEELRIWSCGCSTGEEAYTLAMLALEAFDRAGSAPRLRVLATDVHSTSVQTASAGVYSAEALADLPDAMKSRYFIPQPSGLYRVSEMLRRCVVFAVHNVLRDAAFPRMDLVVCRNLLIYLQPQAQLHALAAFHFALKPSGWLFLGESENTGELNDAFEAADASARLYRKLPGLQLPPPLRATLAAPLTGRPPSTLLDARSTGRLHEVLTQRFLPTGLLVAQTDELVHVFGDAGRYLNAAPGRFGANVLNLLAGPLRSAVMMTLRRAAKEREPVTQRVVVGDGDAAEQLDVTVHPVIERSLPQAYYYVGIQRVDEAPPLPVQTLEQAQAGAHAQQLVGDLEAELQRTREALQRTVEDLESANEELQAGNEELMAANEELQSTNEELHAVNEELYTVNAEHQLKIKELHETGADLNNLIRATELALIFLDSEYRVRLFTPPATELFPLRPQDVGRELHDFLPRELDDRLFDDLADVLARSQSIDRELLLSDGRRLRRRASPYRDSQGRAAGVVLTYVDVTEQVRLRESQVREEERARIKALIGSVPHLMWTCDGAGRCEFFSPQWVAYTGVPAEQQLGYGWLEQVHPDDRARLTADWQRCVDTGQPLQTRFRIRRHDGEFRWFETQAVAHRDSAGRILNWYGSNTDVHDVLALQHALTEQQRFIRLVADQIDGVVGYWDHGLRCQFANQKFLDWFGRRPEEVVGLHARDLLGRELYEASLPHIEAVLRGQPQRFEQTIGRPDGRTVHMLASYSPHTVEGVVSGFFVTMTDITGIHEARLQLQEMFNASPVAQLLVGADGRIIEWNPTAEGLLGYGADALRNLPVEHLMPPDYRLRHRQLRDDFFQMPRARRMTELPWLPLLRADGSLVDVGIELRPLVRDGQPVVLAFIRDRPAPAKGRQADLAEQARGAFLAQMSHEIRTPLNAILGMAQLLQLESPSARQADRLQTIEEASTHLMAIVNDILDLSKIESGSLVLYPEVFAVQDLLDRSIGMVAERARVKRLELRRSVAPNVPARLVGDSRRIEQILVNYLSNAVKFTHAGHVRVVVSCMPSASGRLLLRIEVSDTGIGIDMDRIPELFLPFRQVDHGSARRYGGTGLGLAICRDLARAMDGDTGVRSQRGQGSTFWFTVQVDPVNAGPSAGPAPAPSTPRGEVDAAAVARIMRDKRLLLVEDNAINRLVARELVRQVTGVVPVEADGGEEALRRVAEQDFDLVLMDIQMPGLDGLEVTRRLRRMPRMSQVPVIALTANVLPDDVNQCMEAGMTAHLGKPLIREELIALLARLFGADGQAATVGGDRT